MRLTGSILIAIGAAVFTTTGCAVSNFSGNDQVGLRRTASVRDRITRQDIVDRAPNAQNAYEAIQRLKGTWLRPVGVTSFRSGTRPQVYRDNVRLGDLESLRLITVTLVEEIRYYSATEATTQWGTGHSGGAIEVITDAQRNRPVIAASGDEGEGEGEPPNYRPYEPFPVTPLLHLNGASSVVSAPAELRDFWSPSFALGGGVGVTATPNVTVMAAVDYNRYDFQEERFLSFLESVNGSYRLRSREGTEVQGAPMTLLNLYVGMKAHPNWQTFVPYLTGGVGYMRMTAGAFSLSGPNGSDLPSQQFLPGRAEGGDARENSVSLAVGGGFDFNVTRNLGLFVDGRYVIGFRGPRYTDVTGDLQLLNTQYFPFRFGLSYRMAHLTIARY